MIEYVNAKCVPITCGEFMVLGESKVEREHLKILAEAVPVACSIFWFEK